MIEYANPFAINNINDDYVIEECFPFPFKLIVRSWIIKIYILIWYFGKLNKEEYRRNLFYFRSCWFIINYTKFKCNLITIIVRHLYTWTMNGEFTIFFFFLPESRMTVCVGEKKTRRSWRSCHVLCVRHLVSCCCFISFYILRIYLLTFRSEFLK
jgi:hypothetical protein